MPSASGFYSRQSVRPADEKAVLLEISKSNNSAPDMFLGFLNQFLASVRLYQYVVVLFLQQLQQTEQTNN